MRKLFVTHKFQRLWQVTKFFQKDGKVPWKVLLSLSAAASLGQYGLLYLLTHSILEGRREFELFVLLFACLTIFLAGYFQYHSKIIDLTNHLAFRLRHRMINRLRQTSFHSFENLDSLSYKDMAGLHDTDSVYVDVDSAVQVVAEETPHALHAVNSLVVLFFGTVYLFYLSPLVGSLFVLVFSFGTAFNFWGYHRIRGFFFQTYKHKTNTVGLIRHLTQGFSELKINPKGNESIYEHIEETSESWAEAYTNGLYGARKKSIFLESSFYLILIAVVLIIPSLIPTVPHHLVRIVVVVLFLSEPVVSLIQVYPSLVQLNVAVERLYDFENILDEEKMDSDEALPPAKSSIKPSSFEGIEARDLCFNYTTVADEVLFCLGPLNFQIPQGSITFLAGDNGSGKSTLLKLLVGLYPPFSGKLTLNAQGNSPEEMKHLFSVVFAEGHLFDQLYGLQGIDEEQVNVWLKRVGLFHKTQLIEGQLKHQTLSTGQKKRLALVLALLEDNPIVVFDEWAAEQDSQFRDFFYNELLPELKQQGKTVIASTHDPHYFPVADQIIELEAGWMVGEEKQRSAEQQVTDKRYRCVRQKNEADCGAACLASVCLYEGKRVSFHEMRKLTQTGVHGSSLYNLANGFKEMGYQTQAVEANLSYLTESATLPAILHWNGDHWVVLYEVTPSHAILADPAKGLVKLPLEQFNKSWTGYTLLLEKV